MVDELIPTELPEHVRSVVIDRAAGNPFFVEELVRTLIDKGVLERRNGEWTVQSWPAALLFPTT